METLIKLQDFWLPFYFKMLHVFYAFLFSFERERKNKNKKKRKEKERRRIGGCGLLATNNTEVMLVFVCRDFHFV